MSQWWQILNMLRRQMFALGLSYAQLLARLVVERWKVVEVWPSFSRDANIPLDGLRSQCFREDEISELTKGAAINNVAQSRETLTRHNHNKARRPSA
jgi:hypothetical protein